ncbi:MAG: hypothetical protein IPM82_02865 [Saprospiraceae bacterium]|nr:hypothetical protein [Saprospiraceae bacterium]
MKISFHPILLLTSIFAIALFTTGCPVGIAYPLCEESQVQKMTKTCSARGSPFPILPKSWK